MRGLGRPAFEFSRREILRLGGAAAITVLFRRLASAGPAADSWSGPPGEARQRIDGLAKVTGRKIYARDFRARDMDGWPPHERVAMVLRATRADRVFEGLDLTVLPASLQPIVVVTGDRLIEDKITPQYGFSPPSVWPNGLLVVQGRRPGYYGQPVAILVFADFETWRQAKKLLQFNPKVVKYGSTGQAIPSPDAYKPTTSLTRYADRDDEAFSQVLNGESNPHADPLGPIDAQARAFRQAIAAEFDRPGINTLEASYATQVLDPMFLEPEAGLAWLDTTTQTLSMVLGTQSTNGDLKDAVGLFAAEGLPVVKAAVLNACYPGGGFGGRDTSTFPPLLALAAAYAAPFGNLPVRIAQDRYEQFQAGLKQLDCHAHQRIAFDNDGNLVALISRMELHGGGLNNYSQWVAELAAYCGGSGYRIDKVAIDAAAIPTPGVVSGSMRGFGGPQASFAVECLIDEVAAALGRDPIALREQNALRRGDKTVTGAPVTQELGLREICRLARSTPLWIEREADKARGRAQGELYGVGFALANQAYGTGSDGTMAEVEIAPDGGLTVYSNCVDMGNGSATTLAISTARNAGANAFAVRMGEAARFVSPLGFDASLKSRPPQWDNPRWTAVFSLSSSACMTAFQQVHAVEQATLVLFETALLPAAARLWQAPIESLRGKTYWRESTLVSEGRRPLGLPELSRAIYDTDLPAAAMTHAVHQARWIEADFQVDDWLSTLPLDGLSTRLASASVWRRHDRRNTKPAPPDASRYGRSLFSPSGALAAVRIDPQDFRVRVVAMESFLDAGRIVQSDLLEGQSQGGVAMGIGYALKEALPLMEDGPGDGRWNLDRYHVAMTSDMPLDHLRLTILPTDEPTGRGIGESVLCPIAPAIANAIAHATDRRFRELPITPDKIRAAWR